VALPGKATLADTYGGPYANERPVEDNTTEVDAPFFNEMAADAAATTRTAVRAWVAFAGTTYTAGDQVIAVVDHDAVWGASGAVEPDIIQNPAGTYTITWPATVDDELGETHTLDIQLPLQPTLITATLMDVRVSAYTANTITLKTFSVAGAADALNGVAIKVCWI
jgi:hypothetical protein